MANTSSFYGNLEGNATSADRINHTLTIGDKVFDGSANVEISRISIALLLFFYPTWLFIFFMI